MMGIPQCVGPCQFNKLQAEIDRLRTWLGDSEMTVSKFRAALEEIINPNHEPPYRYSDAHEIASKALAKEGK